jgi:predicted nucleotidyltransferase
MRTNKKKTSLDFAIELATQYIEMCNQSGISISNAILFGSQTSNSANNDSDIDLLLVSSKFKNNTLENWKLLAPVTARLFDIEPHPYPTAKFIKGDPFLDEIKRTGIEIKVK